MAILPPDPVYIMRGNMGPVHSLLFKTSPYAEHLYAGAESGIVHIWDLKTNRETGSLELQDSLQCLSIQALGDDELIIQRKGGSYDCWRSVDSDWSISRSIETDYFGFARFEILTEDLLLLPLAKGGVGVFSLKSHEIVRKLEPSKVTSTEELGEVMAIRHCKLESKNIVIVGYENGVVASWDVDSISVNNYIKNESCPMTICFDSFWMRGVIGTPADKLDVFNLTKNYELVEKTAISLKNAGTSVLATRTDSKVFAAGCWDTRVKIYSWKTLRPLVVLDQHRESIHDIAYSEDKIEAYGNKNIMAAAGKDGIVSLWDIYN